MTRRLLTGNGASAWGARLAKVDYIPAFPITPQTEIIETLGKWIDDGEMDSRMVTMESEHSMVTAAGSASVTGVRVYTATSSQGLLYAMEMLYNASGWRAPLVMTNVSRGLAAPITLESDHNDIMAVRDSGFLQIHCTTCQEVLDSTLMAYRLAEDPRVRLPVIVNLDGFYLSFTREPVEIPDADLAAKFVGEFDAENIRFRASSPASQAVAVLGGTPYSYFRYELHLAAMNAIQVYDEVASDFRDQFGRDYPAVESYYADDADYVFVMIGSFASKAKEAVDRLKEEGWSIGLVRPRLLRPFPFEGIRKMLAGKKGVAVIDQNISMGMGGILHSEICSAMYGQDKAPKAILSFIGGLGGRDISAEEFYEMAKEIREAVNSGKYPSPRLLYTRNELREVTKLQAIAQVEREELGIP
ncbi:MAG: pyruvate synthase [Gammaproteobacteria bacterium]|nr:pyruvate synthase [Gammaproteobacteria bacterium]